MPQTGVGLPNCGYANLTAIAVLIPKTPRAL